MNWGRWIPHAARLVLVLALAAAVYNWVQARNWKRYALVVDARADSALRFADSVHIVNAAQLGHIVRLTRSADRSDSMAGVWRDRAQATETALGQLAAVNVRLNDSLGLVRTASDSLRIYPQLVAGLREENATLRTSRDDALRADAERKAAVDSLRIVLVVDSARYNLLDLSHRKMEAALVESRQALARSSGPCSFLLFGCPSRKASAVAGAIVGGVATAVYFKRGA